MAFCGETRLFHPPGPQKKHGQVLREIYGLLLVQAKRLFFTVLEGRLDLQNGPVAFQSKPSLVLPPILPIMAEPQSYEFLLAPGPATPIRMLFPRQPHRISGVDLAAQSFAPLETSPFLVESAREGHK